MIFPNEYDYLIHLIKCAIHNEQPCEKPESLSFESVFDYSVAHDIANLAFYSIEKLKSKPDISLYEKWESRRDMAITRDINQSFAREEILAEFEKENIKSIEVQGTIIKKLYPQSDYRTMSDIDFIVEPENLHKAGAVLQKLGYDCKEVNGVEIDGFRQPNINVEIHTEYFPKSFKYHNCMRAPFDVMSKNNTVDINELYLYNILHVAKHYNYRGCGIRRILDVYYLNLKYKDVINRDYVKSVLEKVDEIEFSKNVSLLAECWFGNAEYNTRLNDMAQYIKESKLHGTAQIETENNIRKAYSKTRFPKVKYFFRRIFPGDDIMCVHYPILKKCRLLYPIFWVHRLFRAIFSKKSQSVNEAKQIFNANVDRNL